MRVLSFDVATKSLAFAVIEFDGDWMSKCMHVLDSAKPGYEMDALVQVNDIIGKAIQMPKLEVVDLAPGLKSKEVDPHKRARSLKQLLSSDDMNEKYDSVLLEYQMSANYNANAVYNQLLYHYANYDVKTVKPSMKNTLKIGKVSMSELCQKYSTKYKANKVHSTQCVDHILKAFNLKWPDVKTKNKDDISDAIMQALYVIFKA